MTKPINIYLQSRINDENAFNIIKNHSSNKRGKSKIKKHEILSLSRFVDGLIEHGIPINMMDGFFYGYEIMQIGKEFDLLKISNNQCLNIELKSQKVSEKQILNQLIRNKYYLAHLGKEILAYTVITDTLSCYKLCENNRLEKVDFEEIANIVKVLKHDQNIAINKLFKASTFLVSPLSSPEKFVKGEYFLTQAQEQVKKKILSNIATKNSTKYYSIVGHSGTGKTLLVYDLAKTLAKREKNLILHCGRISNSHVFLCDNIKNLNIFTPNILDERQTELLDFKFILVDEAHRLYPKHFYTLCKIVKDNNLIALFSSDPEQVISKAEVENDILSRINTLNSVEIHILSDRIRTNNEMYSFITAVMDLKKKARKLTNFDAISLCYANDYVEAKHILEYFQNKNYAFINCFNSNENFFAIRNYDVHQIIGQDFEKVVMLMDNTFYYDEKGKLQSNVNLNSEYIYTQLFYQGITRAKDKLALIVIDNKVLFEKISQILQ